MRSMAPSHGKRKPSSFSQLTIIAICISTFSIFVTLYVSVPRRPSSPVLSQSDFRYNRSINIDSFGPFLHEINENLENDFQSIPIPTTSHFFFDHPPTDLHLWEVAKNLASQGKQILLSQVLMQFQKTTYSDFLDADNNFKKLYTQVDLFMYKENAKSLFDILANASLIDENQKNYMKTPPFSIKKFPPKFVDKEKTVIETVPDIYQYTPGVYDFKLADRSPIVSLGYHLFEKSRQGIYFDGVMIGSVHYMRRDFVSDWNEYKNAIKVPFVIINVINENFGGLSNNFPNRTTPKGPSFDSKPWEPKFKEFLDDANTLLFLTNQHHNYSHPKVLSRPLGLNLVGKHTSKMIYDTMLYANKNIKKERLLLTAASNWRTRPQIIDCIKTKVSSRDFEVLSKGPNGLFQRKGATTSSSNSNDSPSPNRHTKPTIKQRSLYYQHLASAKFVLGLPGIGYDCYRNWEALTMGSVIVLERGVGLDRTLWRLPALLVEDFADITTELLRSAYVEAMYRALTNEFEFERLTQSFWISLLMNVSTTKSGAIVQEKFPMKATDQGFTRAWVPYECGQKRPITCGRGTKRIPVKSC